MIKFSISLSNEGKTKVSRRRILDYLKNYGIEQTSGGLVTLSFVATRNAFEQVFGPFEGEVQEPQSRQSSTVGASGLFDDARYAVPDELKPFVDSISIAPSARHFDSDV